MYERMKIELLKEIRNILADTYEVITFLAYKNGKEMDAFSIREEESKASPTFYFENYFKDYCAGTSIDTLAREIIGMYYHAMSSLDVDVDNLNDFETQKDKIVYRLVNKEMFKNQLNDIPHIDFFDLAIVFYCMLDINEESVMSYLVTNSAIEMWGIKKELLFTIATKNTPKVLPVSIFSMIQFMFGDIDNDLTMEEMIEVLPESPMYIVSNVHKKYGFASILYPNLLELIGNKLGNFYILPSSLHEALIVPVSAGMGVKELKEMVRSVNATEVEPEDLLSNSVYLYDTRTQKIDAYM